MPKVTARDWSFESDGDLDANYAEMRGVTTRKGEPRTIADFYHNGGIVSVWLSDVLKNMLLEELEARGKDDFEPREHMVIRRGKETVLSTNGFHYWPYDVAYGFPAAKKSARDLLRKSGATSGTDEPASVDEPTQATEPSGPDDDAIPF